MDIQDAYLDMFMYKFWLAGKILQHQWSSSFFVITWLSLQCGGINLSE
jgi:hypothetical protein